MKDDLVERRLDLALKYAERKPRPTCSLLPGDNFARAAESAEYRALNSEIARCYLALLRHVAALSTRELSTGGEGA